MTGWSATLGAALVERLAEALYRRWQAGDGRLPISGATRRAMVRAFEREQRRRAVERGRLGLPPARPRGTPQRAPAPRR